MSFKTLKTASILAAAVAVAAACSFIADTDGAQCQTTADCTTRGAAFAGLVCNSGVCVKEGCATNSECIDANGGKPFICNKTSRQCVNLQVDLAAPDGGTSAPGASAQCRPYLSEGKEDAELRNDDTVWVGLLTSTTGSWGGTFGTGHLNFTEMARREIMDKNAGLPSATPGGKTRPIAFVHCEINDDPQQGVRAAKYLTEQAGFKFFIGGDQVGTFLPMEQEVFLPNKVLNVSIIGSGVADIPSGDPPLAYQLGGSLYNLGNTAVSFLGVLESRARARYGLKPTDNVRYSFVTNKNLFIQGIASQIEPKFIFNGKDVIANGSQYYQRLEVSENATPGEYDEVVKKVVEFNPHVTLLLGFTEMSDPILKNVNEKLTNSGAILNGPSVGIAVISVSPALFTYASVRPELQSRLLWISPNFAPQGVRLKLSTDYPRMFPDAPPLDPVAFGIVAIPYDAFYMLAYAMAANGSNPLTPENVAKSLPKVFAKGSTEVRVGQDDIYKGFSTLGGGGSIFLKGLQALRDGDENLDLDLKTGTHPYWPYLVYCPLSNENAGFPLGQGGGRERFMVSGQPSGLTFTYPDHGRLEGSVVPACSVYATTPDGGTGDGG